MNVVSPLFQVSLSFKTVGTGETLAYLKHFNKSILLHIPVVNLGTELRNTLNTHKKWYHHIGDIVQQRSSIWEKLYSKKPQSLSES